MKDMILQRFVNTCGKYKCTVFHNRMVQYIFYLPIKNETFWFEMVLDGELIHTPYLSVFIVIATFA